MISLIARLFGYRCRYDFWRKDEDGKHAPVWIVWTRLPGCERGSYAEVEYPILLRALYIARLARKKVRA